MGIAIAVIATVLAVYGHDWLHRAFRVLFWLSLPFWAVLTVAIMTGNAGGHVPAHPGGFTFTAFMVQFTVAASYNITYAPYVSDYSRYLPASTRTASIVASVRKVTAGRSIRVVTIVGCALVWAVLGIGVLTNASTALNNSLLIMLYLLAPWTAVNLVDFFFVRRGHYAITEFFTPGGLYGNWAWRGLVSYLRGLALEIPFMMLSGFYTGPAATALSGVDISFIVGLVVAGGTYRLVTRGLDLSREQPVIERSEAALAALADA